MHVLLLIVILSAAKDLLSSPDSHCLRSHHLGIKLRTLLAADFCNTVAGRSEEN